MRPAALRAVPAALIIMVVAMSTKKMKGRQKLRLAVDYEKMTQPLIFSFFLSGQWGEHRYAFFCLCATFNSPRPVNKSSPSYFLPNLPSERLGHRPLKCQQW